MDFITSLLKSDRFGTIMVVVDKFSKYATFMPATAGCTANEASRLFFKNMVKYRRLPRHIISNRDLSLPENFGENCSTYMAWSFTSPKVQTRRLTATLNGRNFPIILRGVSKPGAHHLSWRQANNTKLHIHCRLLFRVRVWVPTILPRDGRSSLTQKNPTCTRNPRR